MLWNYAPATVMVGARPVDRHVGASGCDLPVGRCGRRGSLLRSSLAGRRKDRHGGFIDAVHGGTARHLPGSAEAAAACAERPQLQRIYDHLAGTGSSFLWRRRRRRAPDAITFASAQSNHHLAFERPAAGFSAGRHFLRITTARSRHVFADGDHHRSANRRVTEQQQRYFLRAPAHEPRAAIAAAQVAHPQSRGARRVR